MQRTISLKSDAMPLLCGEPALVISHLQGGEALSELYHYTLTAMTPDNNAISWQAASNIELKPLIGKQMTVSLQLHENLQRNQTSAPVREISGVVQQIRFVGRSADQAIYQLVLRPWLYFAELTSDFRIFRDKSVSEIIEKILTEYDFPSEIRLSTVYPSLDFQVQYGETDFNFMQRLMEAWGIYWFFEHTDGQHKLVIVDNVAAHQSFSPMPLYYAADAPHKDADYIAVFHYQQTITSAETHTFSGGPAHHIHFVIAGSALHLFCAGVAETADVHILPPLTERYLQVR